jgi:parallel beta-helix repeat protein
MQRYAVLALAAALFATVGSGSALAGHGHGHGPGHPTTVACGQVITQSIKLANDLTNCPADGLVIGANNIKVDLHGHTIDGDGVNAATDDGIDDTGGFDNVTIEHGTIQQFAQGVNFVGVTNSKVEHLQVTQTHRGIELQTASNGNRIEHNKVTANFDAIHLVGSDQNRVDHNDASANTASGIVLITGSDSNKVEHNTTSNNATWGITQDTSNNNVYRHNKIVKNGTAGFEPFNSTGLHFEHNALAQNRIGVELFNTDASFFSDNRITTSTLDGIHSFTGSTGNLFKKNRTDKNGADGIDVVDPGNTITRNHADRNTDLGIFAAPGNTDGGGNKAHGNGNALQCTGVACH